MSVPKWTNEAFLRAVQILSVNRHDPFVSQVAAVAEVLTIHEADRQRFRNALQSGIDMLASGKMPSHDDQAEWLTEARAALANAGSK